MKLSKLIGWALILAPFVVITVFAAIDLGVVSVLKIWAFAALIFGSLLAGMELVHK